MNRSLVLTLLAFVLATLVGCAGGNVSPTAPDIDQPETNDTPGLTGAAEMDVPSSPHGLLGYWDVLIDEENETVEFVPLRTSSFHFNLVPIMEATMGLTITEPPQIIDGVMNVNVKLTHPFPSKLNLSGFDVKGILITEGSQAGFGDPDIKIAGPLSTRLLNADGFTRWWNPSEFTNVGLTGYNEGAMGSSLDPAKAAILNGYKLFADGFDMNAGMNDLTRESRAFFQAGSFNVRHYEISLAGGAKFNYAVDCSWAAPLVDPPVNMPGDFPMEANQVEPFWFEVTETLNTLWYADADHGGNVSYEVTVHSWQGVDNFGSLTVESPGLFTETSDTPVSSTEFFATYEFDFVLPELTSAQPLSVLCTMEVPGSYDTLLTGVDKPLRGYHRHLTDVSPEDPIFNIPPVAIMYATSETDIFTEEMVSFDATESYDPDGYVTLYLWDFNGDGVYSDSFTGPREAPSHKFNNPGTFEVKVKVRDNATGSTVSAGVTVNVTLEINDPPVAVAEATTPTHILEDEEVSFDGTASYDVDGTVVDWQWDFDGDGTYGDAFTGDMETPTAFYPDPGVYFVDLKVTDDEGGVGTLDETIEITVDDVPNVLPFAEAVATTPVDIDACGTVSFDASASYDTDGTVDEYFWDFNGDGTFGDLYDSGTDILPVKDFDVPGAYDVQLKVVDNEGGEDELDTPISIMVTNIGPTADAVATTSTEIESFDTVTFDAAGSIDPDCDDIAEWLWDFDGDGTYGDAYEGGNAANPVNEFTEIGVFDVYLKVIDGNGAEDETDTPITVTVTNKPPVACAEITSDYPYFWETDIYFSAECSEDLDGTIVNWEWDLEADGSYEETGEIVSYYFDVMAAHTMQLRLTDDQGAESLLDIPLAFNIWDDSNMPPVVDAVNHSRTTSQRGNDSEFVALSVDITDIAPPGDTHTFLWECDYGTFDDDESATPNWYPPASVPDPSHFDITVTVTDAMGMFDSGTCTQWVTQWPILNNNPNAVDGSQIISESMKDLLTEEMIDPASFPFPTVSPNGNVVYINWWATWCGWCVVEMPMLEELYQMYSPYDYIHLHIDKSEAESTAKNWILGHPEYNATHWLWDTGNSYFNKTNDWNGNSTGIPQHLVFDRDGNCRGQRVGSIVNTGIEPIDKYLRELV